MGVRWDHCCEVCVPWAVKGWEAAPLCPACTGNRGVLWAVLHCTSALTRPSSAGPALLFLCILWVPPCCPHTHQGSSPLLHSSWGFLGIAVSPFCPSTASLPLPVAIPSSALRAGEPFSAGSHAELGVWQDRHQTEGAQHAVWSGLRGIKGISDCMDGEKTHRALPSGFLAVFPCQETSSTGKNIHLKSRGFSLIWCVTLEEIFKLSVLGPLCTLEFSV